jgi:hypothetical protein
VDTERVPPSPGGDAEGVYMQNFREVFRDGNKITVRLPYSNELGSVDGPTDAYEYCTTAARRPDYLVIWRKLSAVTR